MRFGALVVAAVGSLVVIATASAAPATLSWTRPVEVAGNVTLTGVMCQSRSLCVAYGDRGRLFVSSRPSGGAAAWKMRHIDGSARMKALSCPSLSLCVAYDSGGRVLASRRPIRGAWRRVAIDRKLDSLACPSRALCVGVDSSGDVISSTDPARAGSWRKIFAGDTSPTYECVHYQDPSVCAQTSLSGVSCPSPDICTALDQAGNVVLSTDPAADPSPWNVAYREPPDSSSGLDAVGCTSAHFCFGTDNWGNFLASVNPAAGQSAWAAADLRGADGAKDDTTLDHLIRDAACTSSTACIATSDEMRLFATSDPAARAPDWKPTGLGPVLSITCSGHGWCFAVGSDGVYATHDAARPQSWSHAFNDDELTDATARFSCPSAKLCVAVDARGRLVTGR